MLDETFFYNVFLFFFLFSELAANTGSFAKSAAMLGNAEEHTALSRALSQLAEVSKHLAISAEVVRFFS